MQFNTRYLMVAAIAALAVMLADVMWASMSPDPCPARATMDEAAFPEQSVGSRIGRANALPIFARKHGMTCTTCHTAFPYVNSMGRAYKENGYRLPGSDNLEYQKQTEVSDHYIVDRDFPMAVSGSSVIASKTADGPVTTQPLAGLNVHLAGSVFKWGAAYTKLTAEAGHGLSVGATGRVGANVWPFLNVYAGIGGPFDVDPYNTLSGHKLTATHGHGSSKFLAVNGRLSKFYYQVGATGGANGDLSRERFGTARLAFDLTPTMQVGTFGLYGEEPPPEPQTTEQHLSRTIRQASPGHAGPEEGTTTDDDTSGQVASATNDEDPSLERVLRAGGDVNLSFGNLHTLGLLQFEKTTHDEIDELNEQNLNGYGEVYYTFVIGDRPIFVPLGRVNYEQFNDGQNYTVSALGNLSSYLVANARLGVEYEHQILVPSELEREYRITGFANWAW